jgi:hypothetical protein
LAILAAVGVAVAIGLPIAARRFVPGAEWLGAIGAIPLAGAAAAAWACRRERPQWALGTLGAASVAFVIATLGIVPSVVDRQQRSHEILAAIREFGAERVGAVGGLEPSWVFYGGQTIEEVSIQGASDSTSPSSPSSTSPSPSSPYMPRPVVTVDRFLEGEERTALIVAGRQWPTLRDRYGDRLRVLADSPKFLKNERLLAIAVVDPPRAAAASAAAASASGSASGSAAVRPSIASASLPVATADAVSTAPKASEAPEASEAATASAVRTDSAALPEPQRESRKR